ncbi:TIGR02594 family protein [Ruegeria sp. Ofav3-42]|uniref:TIGR02594 family protein n=1 Tax=Ruegeria sp. Ofav3-42 TaxID=2917759 RepID=UPI001EF4C09F|nr:TIGR02594 family protein [Ruegeria sp. Ofav3-42]MCG7522779.1 TIGR02594 family protein [Ruegeria sp. Ofav3-42]
MSMTFSEMSELISTLETELTEATTEGNATRANDIKTAIDDVTFLRAQSLVAEGNALAAQIAAARISVEQVIARLESRTDITRIVNLASGLGVSTSANGQVTGNSEIIESMRNEPPVAGMDSSAVLPPGGPSTFIAAHKTATKTVLLVDDQGREFLRVGGSRSWRNFNPGNIRKGNFSTNNGAIGDDGSFAIFPDKKTGQKAIEVLLRGRSYGPLTIKAAINRYAPPSENDTDSYVNFVVQKTSLNRGDILDDLRIADIRKIVSAIEMMEGWARGEQRPHIPFSGFDGVNPLGGGAASGVSAAIGAASDWMEIAKREAALPVDKRSEIAGPQSNPRILKYFEVGSTWFDPDNGDETEWCAVFVNYCLETSGYVGTNHPGARSFFWNKKRQFIKLDAPRKFCIAVRRYAPFADVNWDTGAGHVGFVVDYSDTHVTLLGGNQGNTVKEKTFPRRVQAADGTLKSEFVAFMMPVMN